MVMLVILISGTITVKAQKLNTNKSISEQFRSGSVPGWKYGPSAAQPVQLLKEDRNTGKESLVAQLRNGTAPKMQFSGGGSGMLRQSAAPPRPAMKTMDGKKIALTSELPVQEKKQEGAETVKPSLQEESRKGDTKQAEIRREVSIPDVPMQEEKSSKVKEAVKKGS